MEYLTLLSLSPAHLIIAAVVILLLFGGKKIPEMMRGMGSGIKEFKDAVKDDEKKPTESQEDTTTKQ